MIHPSGTKLGLLSRRPSTAAVFGCRPLTSSGSWTSVPLAIRIHYMCVDRKQSANSTLVTRRLGYAVVGLEDMRIAGILSQTPGRRWHYMTGHLNTIQSPINRGYVDDIQYVKVPALGVVLHREQKTFSNR